MKDSPGGRLAGWRSRRCSNHASARHGAEPGSPKARPASGPAATGNTGAGGFRARETRAGEARAGEARAGEARSGETEPRETGASPAAIGESVAAAMQAAIGLLTASLDSPELEAWALPVLIPHDADGLGDLMAGLHLISELLIHELHEATGEPQQAILQRLAILAEYRRGMPSAG
jgi:hypothetical protein